MKVIITIEDTTQGIYPIIQWTDNGVTDNYTQSLSMNLAAQLASTLKRYSELGALRVLDPDKMN